MRTNRFSWVIAFILALGILPSFTALSIGFAQTYPSLSHFTGPLNPLKLCSPLLAFFLWQHRKILWASKLHRILLASLSVGTLATLIAEIPCHFTPNPLREWSVILLGFISAVSFFLLPLRKRQAVLISWAAVIYGSILLDWISPHSIDWLYAHIFDPDTLSGDFAELGRRVLTGIFGRQSLAKLLAWIPWLLIALGAGGALGPVDETGELGQPIERGQFTRLLPWALAIASTAAILATSQRGPFVGALAGWIALGVHQTYHSRSLRSLRNVSLALLAMLSLMWIMVPHDLLETRLKSLVGMKSQDRYSQTAEGNRDLRLQMAIFSLKVIAHHPLGHACISWDEFQAGGLNYAHHSHNLILEQFRSRGWFWGFIHFSLWAFAWVFSWRGKSSALFAAITTTWVLGMADHPWFVLNHSLVLWVILIAGLMARQKSVKISKHPSETPQPKLS